MSDTLETQPQSDDAVAATTDAETSVQETVTETKSDKATPSVEQREGKLYLDGVRIYTRDDTNRIAANARREAETKLLQDLEVDSLDKVKSVINQLQDSGEGDLNVSALRDAVKKREQTVEELRAELAEVKTQMVLKDHIGKLNGHMPANWSSDQKSAVLDLMKARGMLHLEGESFQIRNGDEFITDNSGERPDYEAAVQLVGKSLGLNFGKTGVAATDTPKSTDSEGSTRGLDEGRMKKDPAYRNAYVQLRNANKSLTHASVTDSMVKKQMERVRGSIAQRANGVQPPR